LLGCKQRVLKFKTVKGAHAASPLPSSLGAKSNIYALKASQMSLNRKSSLMKASNLSRAAGTVQKRACTEHSCILYIARPGYFNVCDFNAREIFLVEPRPAAWASFTIFTIWLQKI
jgi:hypothetical protein